MTQLKWRRTGIQNSSGAFKGIGFRKINHEMFKWGQYQPENAKKNL
jgi:hypothetical protein